MSRFSQHGFIADPEIDSEIMLLPKRYMIHVYLYHMYMYGCAFYIGFRVRGNFPVIFQADVFFRNEIREPQEGLVLSPPAVSRRCNWSSSHKDHRSRFFPPLGPVAKCRLEDVRIPSPAFVPCFYGHLAMCV